jgi:hypothetical protein
MAPIPDVTSAIDKALPSDPPPMRAREPEGKKKSEELNP